MQDKLNMKRSITEYDKEGNLIFSKTEYYADDSDSESDAPDIKISFHSETGCENCDNENQDELLIDEIGKELDKMLMKLRILRACKTAARCFLYAAASFAAAKFATKIKER